MKIWVVTELDWNRGADSYIFETKRQACDWLLSNHAQYVGKWECCSGYYDTMKVHLSQFLESDDDSIEVSSEDEFYRIERLKVRTK